MTEIYTKVSIELTLTAQSPFHIGSGQLCTESSVQANETVIDICKDVDNQPYIPAASLKGALRHIVPTALAITLFGDTTIDENNNGSKAAFNVYPGFTTNPLIKPDTITHIETHNSIDESTGAAKQGHLFSKKYVNAEQRFTVQLTGEFIADEDLKQFIKQLNRPTIQLGGSRNNSYGIFAISSIGCRVLTADKLSEWFNSTGSLADFYTVFDAFFNTAANKQQKPNEPGLKLTLMLSTPDPLLIACPEQAKKDNAKNLNFKRDNKGNPVLPASALRGILRSHSRRIMRTICQECEVDPLSAKLWGDQKHPSSIQMTPGILEMTPGILDNFVAHLQNFIAIDRVTGGVSNGAMLQVEAITTHNHFQSDLTLRKSATTLNNDATEMGAFIMLLLTLKDLMAGQLSIGAAKAKGYGRIQAKVKLDGEIHAEFTTLLTVICHQFDIAEQDLKAHLQNLHCNPKEVA